MKSICVFCGSSDSVHADYLTAAHQMGKTLAERGIRLDFWRREDRFDGSGGKWGAGGRR